MVRKAKNQEVPGSLFCDASYLIAYFSTQDQYHSRAVKIGARLQKKKVRLITLWPVVSEAITLLLYHYGYSHALALIHSLPAFEILGPSESDYQEAMTFFKEFNRDKKLSINDLLSYVIIKDRLFGVPVLTFDRDFSRMGLTVFRG